MAELGIRHERWGPLKASHIGWDSQAKPLSVFVKKMAPKPKFVTQAVDTSVASSSQSQSQAAVDLNVRRLRIGTADDNGSRGGLDTFFRTLDDEDGGPSSALPCVISAKAPYAEDPFCEWTVSCSSPKAPIPGTASLLKWSTSGSKGTPP
eukprot:5023652-Prymnesium_polylepis.1